MERVLVGSRGEDGAVGTGCDGVGSLGSSRGVWVTGKIVVGNGKGVEA